MATVHRVGSAERRHTRWGALGFDLERGLVRGTRGFYSRSIVNKKLGLAWARLSRCPVEEAHKVCREYGLVHASKYKDPPKYVVKTVPGRTVRDALGRVVFTKQTKKHLALNRAGTLQLPVYPVVYPPPEAPLSEAEMIERCEAFCSLYSRDGLVMPSADAVGVPYIKLIMFINSNDRLMSLMRVAEQVVGVGDEDALRYVARSGDASALKFLLERRNPRFQKATKDNPKAGVHQSTSDAVLAAVKQAEDHLRTVEVKPKSLPSEFAVDLADALANPLEHVLAEQAKVLDVPGTLGEANTEG